MCSPKRCETSCQNCSSPERFCHHFNVKTHLRRNVLPLLLIKKVLLLFSPIYIYIYIYCISCLSVFLFFRCKIKYSPNESNENPHYSVNFKEKRLIYSCLQLTKSDSWASVCCFNCSNGGIHLFCICGQIQNKIINTQLQIINNITYNITITIIKLIK